jgi:hypothetical protein
MKKSVLDAVNRLLRNFFHQEVLSAEQQEYDAMLRIELASLPPLQRRTTAQE